MELLNVEIKNQKRYLFVNRNEKENIEIIISEIAEDYIKFFLVEKKEEVWRSITWLKKNWGLKKVVKL